MPTFLVAGQSNAAGGFDNNQTWSHGSLTPRMWKLGAGSWATLADPTGPGTAGSVWPRVATQIMAARGQAPDFICTAVGSTGLINGDWQPGGAQYEDCVDTVIASGVTSIDAMLWDQGEGETHSLNPATQATYYAALLAMHDQLQIDTGLTFPMICAQTGTVPYDLGSTAAGIDEIRAAQWQAVVSESDVFPGPIGYDRAAIHWETDANALILAARWWLAIEAAIYGGDNRGPYPISAIENAARTAIRIRLSKPLPPGQGNALGDALTILDDGDPISFGFSYDGAVVTIEPHAPNSPLAGPTTIRFVSGNEFAGGVPPRGEPITLPDGTTTRLPMEPIYDFPTSPAEPVATGAFRVPTQVPFLAAV